MLKHKTYNKKTLRKYFECVNKESKKILNKKDLKTVKNIQKKIKFNNKLRAPRIILIMNENILKRQSDLSKKNIRIAKNNIKKAKHQIKINKKKNMKQITLKELLLLKKYHKQVGITIKKKC
tara:strand:+ start:20940 stop:21305 length:366 start_codon:yes stop_codon:yes gene_type:complete